MVDVDTALAQLRVMPTAPGLVGLDRAVLDELAARRSRRHALRGPVIGLAACGSLVVGVMGAVLPKSPVVADDPLTLGAPAALTPSALLSTAE